MEIRIENKNSVVTADNGLFIAHFKNNVTLQKEDIEVVVNNYDEITQGELWRVLLIFPKDTDVSSEARDYAESREKPAKAEALVIESLGQRILFRFYSKFRSVKYPIKEFSNREAALAWLKKFE